MSEFSPRPLRVLITGGAGFLGAALAARARAVGHTVITFDQQEPADRLGDIGDAELAGRIVRETAPEIVVHLAAALTDAAAADAIAATRVNALGTAAIFAASLAVGIKRVIYASSVAAVGPCAEGSGDDVPLAPRSIYGATKAFGEHLARAMSGQGTEFLALRFGWVYGPGRARGWRVAQEMIERFAEGRSTVSYPDIAEPMDWTYVDDATEVLLRALDGALPPLGVLNVVGDRRPIADAATHLARRFPQVRPDPVPTATPPSGWGIRNDGLQACLGHAPVIRLEDGIDRYLAALLPAADPAG